MSTDRLRELIAKCDQLRADRYNTPNWDAEVMHVLFHCRESLEALLPLSESGGQPVLGEDAWIDEFVEAAGPADKQTRTAIRRVFKTILRAFAANMAAHRKLLAAAPSADSGALSEEQVRD